MKVHIIVHYWNNPDHEDTELVAAYQDLEQARAEMKRLAHEEKEKEDGPWHEDFTWEDEDSVCFGWYGEYLESDWVWSWRVDTLSVQ